MQLTIHNAILDTTLELVDVAVDQGKIVTIQPGGGLPEGDTVIQAGGAMLSPAFIDSHFHVENALIWDPANLNQSGTLREAISLYGGVKVALDIANITGRARRTFRAAISNGTLWMRNHVDIDQYGKLRLLEGVLAAQREFADIFTLQIIAFPQFGMARNPEAVDLMWQALEIGAAVVGGMPHGEKNMDDAARQIEIAFEMANKHNLDIDMHVDETDDPYWHSLELLAEKTIEAGYQGRVTAGHCCAMAAWDKALFERVLDKVVRAGVNICTLAPVNLLLQGRKDEPPVRRGIARVRELIEAGVNVTCGQDDLNNMFYPFGKMDLLEVANFVAHAAQLSSPRLIQYAFDMPRYRAAQTLRIDNYGVRLGAVANLVLLDAESAVDAVRRQPERRWVIREGKVLYQAETRRSFAPEIPML